jgi:hypothetical protein
MHHKRLCNIIHSDRQHKKNINKSDAVKFYFDFGIRKERNLLPYSCLIMHIRQEKDRVLKSKVRAVISICTITAYLKPVSRYNSNIASSRYRLS